MTQILSLNVHYFDKQNTVKRFHGDNHKNEFSITKSAFFVLTVNSNITAKKPQGILFQILTRFWKHITKES